MKKVLAILILFVFCARNSGSATIEMPDGWKRPTDKLFNTDWREKDSSQYLRIEGDFNCDGFIDSAFILEPNQGQGIGLFVFLRDKSDKFLGTILYDSRIDKANIGHLTEEQKEVVQKRYRSVYGIRLVSQGLYKTACGKEYYDCADGEPEEILLKCVGIDFFHFDAGGNRFYYWDNLKKKFLYQWMSD